MDLAMGILPPNTSKDITKALIDAEKAFENGLTTVDDAGLDKKQFKLLIVYRNRRFEN